MSTGAERVDPVAEYNLAVVAATTMYPQSAPGVAMVAAETMRQLGAGDLTAGAYSRDDIANHRAVYDGMVTLTAGIHRMFGTPENPNPASDNLRKAVRFADGIIRIATVTSANAYGMGTPAPELRLLGEGDHSRFDLVVADMADVADLERVYSFATSVAFAPGGHALDAARTFRSDLLANNADLKTGRIGREEHGATKGRLVGGIGVTVCEMALEELVANPGALEGIDPEAAEAALKTLFTAPPNPEIPSHYYGQAA